MRTPSRPDGPLLSRFPVQALARRTRPELACLLAGMAAAMFLGWTMTPDSGWSQWVGAVAAWFGPQAAVLVSELPDLVGIGALLAVGAGVVRKVTPPSRR